MEGTCSSLPSPLGWLGRGWKGPFSGGLWLREPLTPPSLATMHPLLALQPYGRRPRHTHPARAGEMTSQQPLQGCEMIATTKYRPMLPHAGMSSDFMGAPRQRTALETPTLVLSWGRSISHHTFTGCL